MHWVRGPRPIEVIFVGHHEGAELYFVLLVDDLGIGVVKVEPIVHLGRMVFAWSAHCVAPDGTATLPRHATSVVADVVHVVLLPLLLQFGEARFSVAARSRCRRGYLTGSIPDTLVMGPVEFRLAHLSERVRILLPEDVVVGA